MSIMRIRTVLSGAQGLPGLSTLYFNGTTATPNGPDAADVVARVRAFWFAIIGSLPTGNTAQVSGQVDLLDPSNGALVGSLVVTAPAIVTGTGGGTLPPANAILLTGQTGTILNGRRFRGRTFISPVASGTGSAGNVAAGTITAMTTAANNMLIGTTSSVPVVWHRPKLPGPLGGSVTPTITFTVGSVFAVLRSRRD